jgi:HK97 family phage major capsid protein
MSATALELRGKRANLVDEARKILDGMKDGRFASQEEENRYNAIDTEIDQLGATIEKVERQETRERELAAAANSAAAKPGANSSGAGSERAAVEAKEERVGRLTVVRNQEQIERSKLLRRFIRGDLGAAGVHELRALQADDDVNGGYTVRPEEFVARLIKAVDDMVFMRQLGTVMPVTSSESIGAPSLDSDPADADWTTEIATGNEDSSMAFGKVSRWACSRRAMTASAPPATSAPAARPPSPRTA